MENQANMPNTPEPPTPKPAEDAEEVIWDEILTQLKTESDEQPRVRRRFDGQGQ